MNNKDKIADFMRKTDSALIVGNRQMYFLNGAWVVADLPRFGSRQQVLGFFKDTVPELAVALKTLANVDASS